MADYSGTEAIFVIALPQIYDSKYPDDEPFSRQVRVTDEADDNFVVSKSTVLISPKALGDELNVVKFCARIARACHDFDRKHIEADRRLQEEFQGRLQYAVEGIIRRWGPEVLDEWLKEARNGKR